ncbi:MAG TPA: DUF3365 domain-containing protein, partial [Gammaproteobacteria bacterium]|nr:DUF3365 domain-containing protein [Gammaproteobacteria bacterium]
MHWKSLGFRASLLSGLILVVFAATLFVAYYLSEHHGADHTAVVRARSIVMMAEAAMEYTQTKWQLGVYSTDRLRKRLQNAESPAAAKQIILDAVPVSNAWQTAQAKQKEAGFRFRPVARHPRNPDYAPEPLERRALRYFDRHPEAKELHLRDSSADAVRYFRPIHVEKSCLKCHGDPANSRKYWGNDKGRDPSGQEMEGRKLGSLYGAFEVSVPLEKAQQRTAANLRYGGAIASGMLVLALLTVFWLMRRTLVRPLAEAVTRFNGAAREGDLRVRLPEQGSAEVADLGRGFNR